MKRKYKSRITNHRSRIRAGSAPLEVGEPLFDIVANRRLLTGSAFILAVVMVTLLAIIGVMFLMTARVNRIATSAIAENRELNFAVETVIARISQQLVSDVPGMAKGDDYYDYPDPCNPWLANLEPYEFGGAGSGDYRWLRISDIYNVPGTPIGMLEALKSLELIDDLGQVAGPDELAASIISQDDKVGGSYDPTDSTKAVSYGGPADADGDGVADSRWIQLPDMTTGKGKPIYAAIRVVDNSGMLNVNTGYKFDPSGSRSRIDGSSQTQINLLGLSQRGSNDPVKAEETLSIVRTGNPGIDISDYAKKVVWRYNQPVGSYTPFDISDELELRNRFFLKQQDTKTRIKERLRSDNDWGDTFAVGLYTPRDDPSAFSETPDYWFGRVNIDPDPSVYDYRHISTTYNMDRIINPVGGKMVNVNEIRTQADLDDLRQAIRAAVPTAVTDSEIAQMAVNIKDFSDERPRKENSNVSTITVGGNIFYGFERPCIFISELATNFQFADIPGEPNDISYAIELRKRHRGKNNDTWKLVIENPSPVARPPINIGETDPTFASDRKRYHVIVFENRNAPLAELVVFSDSPEDGEEGVDPNVILDWGPEPIWGQDPCTGEWIESSSYDVYFGLDYNDVSDANRDNPLGVLVSEGQIELSSDPYDPITLEPGLQKDTTYYWRIAAFDASGTEIDNGNPPWSFTVGDPKPYVIRIGPGSPPVFDIGSKIELRRYLDGTDNYITVDSVVVPPELVDEVAGTKSYKRDVGAHRWIKRLWSPVDYSPSLGNSDGHNYPEYTEPIQVRFGRFNNVGEIGQVFSQDIYNWPWGEGTTETEVRLNLINPNFQNVFKYLTVMDPDDHGHGPDETRIKGRININTAPWYVIAQLPWVSPELAQAIVAYRDRVTVRPPPAGFRTIWQLNKVVSADPISSIDYYARDYNPDSTPKDQRGFPDLRTNRRTKLDGAIDDFEERDLIFARISDLVTVRSDVFTAYILVRIGPDGPQKRVIAILDRSGVYPDGAGGEIGRVKIVALHPVPDPR